MRFTSSADRLFQNLSAFGHTLETSEFLATMLKACLIVTLAIASLRFAYVDLISEQPFITDFNAFYLAGKLALERKLAIAYHFKLMNQAQLDFYGIEGFLPWSYPPPFDLIVALLALLPIGVASLLFSGFTLLGYFHVMDQITPVTRRLIRFIVLPTLLLNITVGQNGLLTGTLMAIFCLLTLKKSPWAGVPLGLMVIKPHLALGFGLISIFRGYWRTVIAAFAVAGAFAFIATGILGPQVWKDFGDGISESASFLKSGVYPLFRMTSAFAGSYTLTNNLFFSQAIQTLSTTLALVSLLLLTKIKLSDRELLGMVALISPFFSPYFYDYDLPVIGLGIALLFPTVSLYLKTSERIIAIWSVILAQSGWGFCLFTTALGSAATPGSEGKPPSLGAFFLLFTLLFFGKAVLAAHSARSRIEE